MHNQKEIQNNKNIFDALIKIAEKEKSEQKKLQLLRFSALWAVSEHTGQFSSLKIEKMLSSIADKHSVKKNTLKKNTFLHVMTEALSIGGHTPLANQWIRNSDEKEIHSLALIDQSTATPSWLETSIKDKSGSIYKLDPKKDLLSNALELREIASNYEYIIMHVNMNDIVPCLAFSTLQFRRPVIFMNHADHIFWLGLSYTDMLVNLTEAGNDFSLQKRGKVPQKVLPIPVLFEKDKVFSKKEVLEELGLPTDKKIILSMASAYKYRLFDDYPFIDILLSLSRKNPHCLFLIIGADKAQEEAWQDVYKKSHGKINAMGIKQPEEVLLYKRIADLYIDSIPINSYTSFLEFAAAGVPSLSLKTEFNSLDILEGKKNLCHSRSEIIQHAEAILNQELQDEYNLEQEILDYYSPSASWKSKKNDLVAQTPKTHTLHWHFAKKEIIDSYDDIVYTLQPVQRKKALFMKEIDFLNNLRIMRVFYRYKYLSSSSIPAHFFKIVRKALF